MERIIDQVNDFFNENSFILLESLVILIVGIIAIRILLTLLKRVLKKQNRIDPISIPFIRSITKVLLYMVLFIMIAAKLGFSTTSLATILAAVGLAISLSLQSSLGNIVNGIFLMLSKPFVRGSVVSIDGVDGVVDSIGLIYTKLTSLDKQVLIPNSDVANAKISDLSSVQKRRFDVKLTLAYAEDISDIRQIMLDVAKNFEKHILDDPEAVVAVTNLVSLGMEVELRVWLEPSNYAAFGGYIYEALKGRFDLEGIVIPSIGKIVIKE